MDSRPALFVMLYCSAAGAAAAARDCVGIFTENEGVELLACWGHGEAAFCGFAQGGRQGVADALHGEDGFVGRNVAGDAGEGDFGRHEGGGDAAGVALDARNFDEAGNRIADETKDVFDGDGNGFAAHGWRAASQFNHGCSGHGTGGAAFGLAAAGSAGEGSVVANDHADSGSGEEGHDAVVFVEAVFFLHGDDGCRQDAAAARGWRGNDAAHGGVEFADGEGAPDGTADEAAGERLALLVNAIEFIGIAAGEAAGAADVGIGAFLDAFLHDMVIVAHFVEQHLGFGVHLLGLVAKHDLADGFTAFSGSVDKFGDAGVFQCFHRRSFLSHAIGCTAMHL